jgi:predicted dehydrogenase
MSAIVFHIPLIQTTPTFRLAAIVQRTPVPGNSAPDDHPDAKHYTSTSTLFADPTIDVVVVTTPPDSHFDLCTSALQAGKHVFVEKPFVPTSAEATRLIATAHNANRLLCVYQNRRWDSDFLTFRKLQKDGALGRIVEFETHFDRFIAVKPGTWKGQLSMVNGGGVVYDLGTHLLDQVYVAFGLPATVTAVFANQRREGAGVEPDAFTMMLQYKDGLVVTAKAGEMSIESEQLRYWVRGTKGSYKKFHVDCQEGHLKAGLKPGDAGFGVEDVSLSGSLTTLIQDKPVTNAYPNIEPETYGALYEGFAKAVEKRDEGLVPVKAEEVRDVLRIIEAAKESAKTGKAVAL